MPGLLGGLCAATRHDYDDIDSDMIWRSVTERLDPLENACRRELAATANDPAQG
jgi:uncharacterized protein with HEPN domain